MDCKLRAATAIAGALAPIRERRAHFEGHRSEVLEILVEGERRARETAADTMGQVRRAMNVG